MSAVTRRELLKGSLALAGVGAVGTSLAACTSSSASTGQGTATPRRGGVAEISMTDAGPNDRLDPAYLVNSHDILSHGLIYDSLVRMDQSFTALPGLAESWESNTAGTVWQFKLRKGVTFHNGKTLDADDVVWSLRRAVDPKGQGSGAAIFASSVDPAGIVATDPGTVRLTLTSPNFFLPQLLGGFYTKIAAKGTSDWSKPPGTGPFKVDSFTPGTLLVTARNPNYWDSGRPMLDGVRVVVVPDQATKVLNVVQGTSHLGDTLEFSLLKTVTSSSAADLLTAPGGHFPVMAFQWDQQYFRDPNVRRALQLVVDREAMMSTIYSGHGKATADIPIAPADPFFPTSIPMPARDVEQAKSLLAKAGHSDLVIDQYTSQFFTGVAEIPVVFKQQAAEAGITVNVHVDPVPTYGSDVFGKKAAFMDVWLRQHPFLLIPLLYTPNAGQNESHYPNDDVPKLFAEAAASSELSVQRDKITAACQALITNASQIIPGHVDFVWPKKKVLHDVKVNWTQLVDMSSAYLSG